MLRLKRITWNNFKIDISLFPTQYTHKLAAVALYVTVHNAEQRVLVADVPLKYWRLHPSCQTRVLCKVQFISYLPSTHGPFGQNFVAKKPKQRPSLLCLGPDFFPGKCCYLHLKYLSNIWDGCVPERNEWYWSIQIFYALLLHTHTHKRMWETKILQQYVIKLSFISYWWPLHTE